MSLESDGRVVEHLDGEAEWYQGGELHRLGG